MIYETGTGAENHISKKEQLQKYEHNKDFMTTELEFETSSIILNMSTSIGNSF